MKKVYVKPESEEIRMESEGFLAASGDALQSGDSNSVTPGNGEYNGIFQSRRRNTIWSDPE